MASDTRCIVAAIRARRRCWSCCAIDARAIEWKFVADFADAARNALREEPNIDFALAALTRALCLPPGSALTLFAIGRTIGWIGHAIEQYTTGQLIRPRAKYVGVVPAAP